MAIAFIQSKQNTASTTSVAITFTSNNTAGNLLVVGVEANSTSSVITVSDTLGNTYSSAIGPTQINGGGNQWIQIFYVPNCLGGANTVTASNSSATYMNIVGAEYSVVKTASPLDGAGASAAGNNATPASGTFTVTVDDLIVGFALLSNMVAGSGFTSRGTDTYSMLEDKITSSTSANATFTADSGNWAAQGVAFLPIVDVTVSLTGVLATASVGTIGIAIALALSGVSGTVSAGNITASGGVTQGRADLYLGHKTVVTDNLVTLG